MNDFVPTREDRFSFGLWTVGWQGVDVFGGAVRPPMAPADAVHRLSDLGAYGVTFHDNDVFPFGASEQEREQHLKPFRKALEETGLVVPMATTNLFSHPVFRDGGFTDNDRDVRRFAIRKVQTTSTSRPSSVRRPSSRGAVERALSRGRRRMSEPHSTATRRPSTSSASTCSTRATTMRFAIEPKPNEPRGDILLPTIGHALAFINELEHPEMVGVNPEVGHEEMASLNFAARTRPGAVAREAVPHRPQRPARPALRPGPALRRGQRCAAPSGPSTSWRTAVTTGLVTSTSSLRGPRTSTASGPRRRGACATT